MEMGTPLRYLLIENDENDALLIEAELLREGFTPSWRRADSADEVGKQLSEGVFDLVLSDYAMWNFNGLEALRIFREMNLDIPFIIVSGQIGEEKAVEAMKAGADDYVLKDRLKRLGPTVRRELERVRVSREQQQATEVNAERARRLAEILDNISEGFLSVDVEWRLVHLNRAAERIFRLDRDETIGKVFWDLLAGLAGTRIQAELRRAAEDKAPVHIEDYFSTYDIWLELNVYATRYGLAILARDVTEQRRFNEQIRQTQKLESLGVLAGGVAHDFNNLLTGILGNASLALETISSNNPAKTMLRDVINASERAAHLTRQLLAYAGKGRFVIESLDLSDLVQQISSLIQTSIPKNVQLRLDLPPNLPCVEGDAAQIQQLIMNLVINGAEAIGEQTTGTVLVTTRAQDVDEDYIRTTFTPEQIAPGKYVTMEVHDTGIGMDAHTMAHIFDPFFTTKFTGRGLGLAAVMGIVRGHRGALKVYSTPGHGSTFKVLLPATDEEPVKARPKMTDYKLDGSVTVMVVDDEQVVRRTAKSMLERFGYTVVQAENGQEAVDLFKVLSEKVSVVLLDMTMPMMGGEETLRHMKTINPQVKVILSSGYNEVEAVQRFTGKGLAGFLQKPYTATALAEKVRSVMEEGKPLAAGEPLPG